MKKAVDRAAAGERGLAVEIAAVWPTGARIPWLPLIETDEAAGDTAKSAADPAADPRTGSSVVPRQ